MTVREFIALISKPENQHLLDYDFGIETKDDYNDVRYIYRSSLIARDDEEETAHAVVVSPESLPEGKEEGGTSIFILERRKIV